MTAPKLLASRQIPHVAYVEQDRRSERSRVDSAGALGTSIASIRRPAAQRTTYYWSRPARASTSTSSIPESEPRTRSFGGRAFRLTSITTMATDHKAVTGTEPTLQQRSAADCRRCKGCQALLGQRPRLHRSGTDADVIAGIDWVTANRVMPAVANMSIGGRSVQALNDAVNDAIARA